LLKFIANKNASRKEKLRNEIAQEKRENAAFVQNSERSKMIQNIQRKKQDKGIRTSDSTETKLRRHFPQRSVVKGSNGGALDTVLSKVFK
jgi:hypothetical protein